METNSRSDQFPKTCVLRPKDNPLKQRPGRRHGDSAQLWYVRDNISIIISTKQGQGEGQVRYISRKSSSNL